jgi:hypothetical protein
MEKPRLNAVILAVAKAAIIIYGRSIVGNGFEACLATL